MQRPKTKFQVGLKKRPLPPGNAEPKAADVGDSGTSSGSDSSDEGGDSVAALGSLLGGYGDSSSSDSASDDDDKGTGRNGPPQRAAKKAKTAIPAASEASATPAAGASAFKPTAFVPAAKSKNTLAMEAMRAKMSGDSKKYAELMEKINRGEGAIQ